MKLNKIVIVVITGLTLARVGFAEEISPESTVNLFHEVLFDVFKNSGSLSTKERYTRLASAIDNTFNMRFMIKVAAGTSWRDADEEGRSDLLKAFRRMSIATYVSRFIGYSNQRFKTIKTVSGMRDLQLVYTHIVTPKTNKPDAVIKINYVMKKFKGGWKIVDILLGGGISELAVKHSEYRNILRRSGIPALVKKLNKKADQLMAKL